MKLIAEVLDKLAAEGTADQIAVALQTQGVTGVRFRPDSCPVAVYVTRAVTARVSVGAHRCCRMTGDFPDTAPLPPEIERFIIAFDAGFYPNLF